MHLVRLSESVKMGESLGELPAGDWLMHDQNAFQIGIMAKRGTVALTPFADARMDEDWHDLVAERGEVTVVRSGAIGDLLLLSPALKAFKENFPHVQITLHCFRKHHSIMDGLKEFVSLADYPLPKPVGGGVGISLEDVIETAGKEHATDAFARALGVTVKDYRPVYSVSDEEKKWAVGEIPKERKRVALHLRASTRNRDYPLPLWQKVVDGLLERGWEVLLLGGHGQIPPLSENHPKHIHDCSKYTFRHVAALMTTCDAFCGVDSSFMNLCPALDLPAIGLYGPFPWEARTSKAPLSRGLTGSGDCAPCYWLSKVGRHFPPDQPCARSGYCHVLADIKPERIIAKIDAIKS